MTTPFSSHPRTTPRLACCAGCKSDSRRDAFTTRDFRSSFHFAGIGPSLLSGGRTFSRIDRSAGWREGSRLRRISCSDSESPFERLASHLAVDSRSFRCGVVNASIANPAMAFWDPGSDSPRKAAVFQALSAIVCCRWLSAFVSAPRTSSPSSFLQTNSFWQKSSPVCIPGVVAAFSKLTQCDAFDTTSSSEGESF